MISHSCSYLSVDPPPFMCLFIYIFYEIYDLKEEINGKNLAVLPAIIWGPWYISCLLMMKRLRLCSGGDERTNQSGDLM